MSVWGFVAGVVNAVSSSSTDATTDRIARGCPPFWAFQQVHLNGHRPQHSFLPFRRTVNLQQTCTNAVCHRHLRRQYLPWSPISRNRKRSFRATWRSAAAQEDGKTSIAFFAVLLSMIGTWHPSVTLRVQILTGIRPAQHSFPSSSLSTAGCELCSPRQPVWPLKDVTTPPPLYDGGSATRWYAEELHVHVLDSDDVLTGAELSILDVLAEFLRTWEGSH